jgi:hypothetical protein
MKAAMRRSIILFTAALVLLGTLACNLLATPEPPTPGAEPPTAERTATPPPEPTLAPSSTPATQAPPSPTPPPQPTSTPARGVPLPRELGLAEPSRLRLVDAGGSPVPAQFTPLARWGGPAHAADAPIRWVLIDFQASVGPGETATYFVQEGGPGPTPAHPLVVTDDTDTLTIDTGVARFSIDRADGSLRAPGLSAPLSGRATGADGTVYATAGPVDVVVAQGGPMRISVRVKGAYRDAGGTPLVEYTSRYWFYAGQSAVRLFYTVENNNLCPLAEYGQPDCYDIGSGGSVQIADLSLVAPADPGGSPAYRAGGATGALAEPLLLYQDSSGTDHWDAYPTLTDWDGNPLDTRPRLQSYVRFRGYRTSVGQAVVDSGDRAAGWLHVEGENGTWAVGVRDFWQNYPKALRAAPDGTIEIGLLPGEFGPPDYAFTLRAGEHKTHELVLVPGSPPQAAEEVDVGAAPLFASAPPAWYVASGALGLADWMDWYPSLSAAIEATDFYGMFDYGDWPIDYEGFGVAPLNLKYDASYGLWLQWARGGDTRWGRLAEAANRHIADLDILHNLHSPRHWADGIAFGHSYHDEDGFTNPHRNYGGSHPDTAFGMQGLLLAYYFTGYEKAYEAALELADCIEYRLRNDRHLCAYLADCSGEGYGLGDADGLYEAGARPAANGLSIAVEAYRATADPRYLAVADALVAWSRAANQPYIDGPTGEDQAMRPWMLNAYLRALAGYIEMRAEFDVPDEHSARQSYLAYADWLRTYAWIDLAPIDSGPRAAYPYEWWFDGRTGDPKDEWSVGNSVPSINNWLLLGADAMAYAYRLSGDADYLERAATLFRTGTHDPWFEEDANTYSSTKETANGITFGHVFLHVWAE